MMNTIKHIDSEKYIEMMNKIDNIIALGEKASQGEWKYRDKRRSKMPSFSTDMGYSICDFGDDSSCYPTEGGPPEKADAQFITASANSRQAIKDMRDENLRLREALESITHFTGDLWPQNETVEIMAEIANQALKGAQDELLQQS